MDADVSHRPEDLPCCCKPATDGADVVIGSRNVPGGRIEGWSPLRHAISKGGSLLRPGCCSGCRCGTAPAASSASGARRWRRSTWTPLRANGYAFQVEVNYACARAGLRLAEVPIVFPDRTRGRSKMSARIALEAAGMVLRLRLGPAATGRPVPRPGAPGACAPAAQAPTQSRPREPRSTSCWSRGSVALSAQSAYAAGLMLYAWEDAEPARPQPRAGALPAPAADASPCCSRRATRRR